MRNKLRTIKPRFSVNANVFDYENEAGDYRNFSLSIHRVKDIQTNTTILDNGVEVTTLAVQVENRYDEARQTFNIQFFKYPQE